MNLLISHSWDNKLEADKTADSLRAAGFKVWIDDTDLLAGDKIQATIDKQLEATDIMLLLWSEKAAQSKGVQSEIETAQRLGKQVIVCKLDNTSLEEHPHLRETKSISFADVDDGIGRLKIMLINYMNRSFNVLDEETRGILNEFKGSLESVNELLYKKGLREKEDGYKQYWVDKILRKLNEAKPELENELGIMGEVQAFMAVKMAELEQNLDDKGKYEKILLEMYRHKHSQHLAMKQFIAHVEKMLDSFAQQSEAVSGAAEYKTNIDNTLGVSYDIIKKYTGNLLPDFLFEPIYQQVEYFFNSSADIFEEIENQAATYNKEELINTVTFLAEYTGQPNNIINSNQLGILGYTDDAWVIFLTATRLMQNRFMDSSRLTTNWDIINAAADVLFGILGQQFRQQVEQLCDDFAASLTKKYKQQEGDAARLNRMKNDLWEARLKGLEGDLGIF